MLLCLSSLVNLKHCGDGESCLLERMTSLHFAFLHNTQSFCISLSSLILHIKQSLLPLLQKSADLLQNATVPYVYPLASHCLYPSCSFLWLLWILVAFCSFATLQVNFICRVLIWKVHAGSCIDHYRLPSTSADVTSPPALGGVNKVDSCRVCLRVRQTELQCLWPGWSYGAQNSLQNFQALSPNFAAESLEMLELLT